MPTLEFNQYYKEEISEENAAAWIMFGLITYDHERDIYLIGKAITKLAQRELEEERLAENTLQ